MNSFAGVLPWFLHYGYFALFGFLFLGGLYLPLPSNVALLGAGVLSHIPQDGLHFNFFIAALIAFVASMLGDVGAYYLARRFTTRKKRERLENKHGIYSKVEHYLKKHPIMTVAVTRLIGFLSPAVNSLAGFSKLHIRTFILGDALGNVVCVFLYMIVGYEAESVSGNIVHLLSLGVGVLGVLLVSYVAIFYFLKKK